MEKPTLEQLKQANPIFFDDEWMDLYGGAKYEIVPNPQGGWLLLVEAKYSKPKYIIGQDLTLKFSGHED